MNASWDSPVSRRSMLRIAAFASSVVASMPTVFPRTRPAADSRSSQAGSATFTTGCYGFEELGRFSGPGVYSLYLDVVTEPGGTLGDALPLPLGRIEGGTIASSTDVDYLRIDVTETTWVYVRVVSDGVSIDGALLDSGGNPIQTITYGETLGPDGRMGFTFAQRLDAGTYYLRVSRSAGASTGTYTVRAIEDITQERVATECSAISAPFGDPLSGCQWHLKNTGQLGGTAGEDIDVEAVWTAGNRGSGVGVAVVDNGMDSYHEDLRDNVDRTRNHDYLGGSEVLNPHHSHGTAVAGIVAARDNGLGGRGVAPRATVYGYNLLRNLTDENEADAMTRNGATTAVSNNSWGPLGGPGLSPANGLWKRAVSESAFLTVTAGAAGTGSGTVTYSVGANAGGPRTGGLAVAGQRVTVFQASPTVFADHPIQPGVTPVRAIHFLELRARIDALREREGLAGFGWTDPGLAAGTPIRAVHLTGLRAALAEAYAAAGRAAPGYTDAALTAERSVIRVEHLMELRTAVADLE